MYLKSPQREEGGSEDTGAQQGTTEQHIQRQRGGQDAAQRRIIP